MKIEIEGVGIKMQMVFRWFGEGNDSILLRDIKQIPGVEGLVWALHDIPPGKVWPMDRILEVKEKAEKEGFNIDVVESLNVHEDIKLGYSSRDAYIDNYIETMKNLSKAGVKVICYNFMPVFDWIRTDLFKEHNNGATSLFFEKNKIQNINPMQLVESIASNNYTMPGWEPDRLQYLSTLFEQYKSITEDDLWDNLQYFLERIIPAAEQYDIKMAIHPDDPPFPVFGLPRIITNKENIRKF